MTQCQEILEYMKTYGSISPLEAMREFGCMRLAARINDLENQGHNIIHDTDYSLNRKGKKIHFTRYSLAA